MDCVHGYEALLEDRDDIHLRIFEASVRDESGALMNKHLIGRDEAVNQNEDWRANLISNRTAWQGGHT